MSTPEFLDRALKSVEDMSPEEALQLHEEAQETIMSFQEYMLSTSKSPAPEVSQILNDHWEELI